MARATLLLLFCAAQLAFAAGLAGAGRALLAAAPAVVFTPEDVRAINRLDMDFFGLADSPECEMWKVRRRRHRRRRRRCRGPLSHV
jgi:hypothetical protein